LPLESHQLDIAVFGATGVAVLLLDLLAAIAQQKGVGHAEEAALSASMLVVGPPGECEMF